MVCIIHTVRQGNVSVRECSTSFIAHLIVSYLCQAVLVTKASKTLLTKNLKVVLADIWF